MTIEVPELDNRKFQDIVDKAKERIPGLAPAWTNHNLSDPGVALIELFAWMTDMTLYQLNQLPDRAMRKLLNSVGFEMFPAQAARVDLEFSITHPQAASGLTFEIPPPVVIPKGTEVGTTGLDETVIFATQRALELHQPVLRQCINEPTGVDQQEPRWSNDVGRILRPVEFDPPLVCFTALDRGGTDAEAVPADTRRGVAVYFGFALPLSNAVVEVAIEALTRGLGIDDENPPILWEASTANGFESCAIVDDATGGLNVDGSMKIHVPPGHRRTRLPIGGDDLHWLALRLDMGSHKQIYTGSPEVHSIAFTTVGGVVPAANIERRSGIELGSSDGSQGQRFVVGEPIVGGEEEVAVFVGGEQWAYRPDFTNTTAEENVFTVNAAAGEIQFAPITRLPDGTLRRHGRIPEKDNTVVADYSVGGGSPVGIAPDQIRNLRVALAYVDGVTNRKAPVHAMDRETIEEALARAPSALRAGERAVTAADFERIVNDADRDLHRVTCRRPRPIAPASTTPHAGPPDNVVQVMIIPAVTNSPSLQVLDDYALPLDLRQRIAAHLEPRRLVGTVVELTTPRFLGVSVAVRLHGKKGFERDALQQQVEDALYRFINPVVGGSDGQGLQLGEPMAAERVEEMLQGLDGVRRIDQLQMYEADLRRKQRFDRQPTRRIQPDDDTVLLSHKHIVHVDSEDD